MSIKLKEFNEQIHRSKLENFNLDLCNNNSTELFVKRDDLIHHEVSGNKWRKLKWNFFEALKNDCNTLSTYGGAYSNHLLATASLGHELGINTRGYVRGHELNPKSNALLERCKELDMDLRFIDRKTYTQNKFQNGLCVDGKDRLWCIPEGGANRLGIRGCAEIIEETNNDFDFIFVAQGTCTTSMGILSVMNPKSKLVVVPVLKGFNSVNAMLKLNQRHKSYFNQSKIIVLDQYHFGGYAKKNPTLISFINEFNQSNSFQIEPVYTGKVMFAMHQYVKTNKSLSKNKKILFIHTGGIFDFNQY